MEEGHQYRTHTAELKALSDYTGLNFKELLELEIDEYKLLLRDAFIYNYNQSEKGREYLETAWILEQSKPDREALRENFT
ncbi:MAG: hypothetical protein ACRCX8_01390 [Sarcina sp.]